MNHTSRMTALLGEIRRERNGAVADSMRLVGRPYGLNYGVSLPTLRRLARAETPDHDFAEFLFRQDVRELRLAAFHIAEPDRLTPDDSAFWAAGIDNNELAEEAAFALLSRAGAFPALFGWWIAPSQPLLLRYAALMAAARWPQAPVEWIAPALDAVHRAAVAAADEETASGGSGPAAGPSAPSAPSAPPAPDADARSLYRVGAHLLAQGAVAFCAAIGARNEETRQAVLRAAGSLGSLPAEDFVHEELAWRLPH